MLQSYCRVTNSCSLLAILKPLQSSNVKKSFITLAGIIPLYLMFLSEPPDPPSNVSAVIKPDNTSPVTAVISWMAVIDNAIGIPPGGNQTLRYFVEVSNSTSAVLFRATVDHPTNTVEAPNLPACENLTVSVTAENLYFNGAPAMGDFMTVEPGW